jgi:polyhydroxybutyrate depolymerase
MKKLVLFLIFGLSLTGFTQQTYETIDISGNQREYYKYLPIGYDQTTEQLPIVIILHGLGGDALSMTTGGINQIADTARFIPLYLQGLPNFLGQNSWNNGTALSSTGDDILFISKIIDEINTLHGIDLTRVYMVGISMGSIMTFHALTELNNRIAAVSCHIGTMSTTDLTNYNPTFPIPVQQIHGTADQTVPYDGTPLQSLSLVPETLDKLKSVNGWLGDSIITNIPDNVNDGITIEKIEYNCTGADLEHWKMTGADHIFLYQPANDTSGIFVSWYFLRQYSHPNPIAVGLNKVSDSDFIVNYFPNPARNQIQINSQKNISKVKIYDINGQLIISETNKTNIDVSNLTSGMYIIEILNSEQGIFKDKLIIE